MGLNNPSATTTAPTQAAGDASTLIANTIFVSTAVANAIAGVNPAVAVEAATAAVLPNAPTYANGVAGVGATLTATTGLTALVVDGYSPSVGDRILVKTQASALQNGIYIVTLVGSGVVAWVLTRALDFNTPSDTTDTGAIPVINGTANAATQWVLTSRITTVGTDAFTFTQFSLAPSTIVTLAGAQDLTNKTATTPALADNSTKLATSAYADRAAAAVSGLRYVKPGTLWRLGTTGSYTNWQLRYIPSLGRVISIADNSSNIEYSDNSGVTWTAKGTVSNRTWRCIMYSPQRHRLVIVGNDAGSTTGMVNYSDDGGDTWTAANAVNANEWIAGCYIPTLDRFVVVSITGTGNRVMTSDDGGVTWTARTSAADNNWRDVCWSPELSLCVAVASSGTGNRVMTSPDGVTWTIRTSPADNNWRAVTWARGLSNGAGGYGLYVAVSSTGTGDRVMTSPDGSTWTTRASAEDNAWNGIAYGPEAGLLVAVATGGTHRIMTSPDALTWTAVTAPGTKVWRDVVWNNKSGAFVAKSSDATTTDSMLSGSLTVGDGR